MLRENAHDQNVYLRLADILRGILSETDLESLLENFADTLREFIPYDHLIIYEVDDQGGVLNPLMARDPWSDEALERRVRFGEGISGWVADRREPILTNHAHVDPRSSLDRDDETSPVALISLPLVARSESKGVLNLYRVGAGSSFNENEFEIAKRFADSAALALDNTRIVSVLAGQALSDPLTGLYNHRHFHERLREELTRASRTRDSTALLMFDIDDFKKVNDIHGHSVGDRILVGIANILGDTVRASDIACRIGGEEFGVILPSCDAGDALGLATRLLTRVSQLTLDEIGRITVSIGISQGPEHAMNPKELVTYAEAAMLTAKAKGGNRVVLFDDEKEDRPGIPSASRGRDVRSVAYLKMLQSLGSKLNRLNNVNKIAGTIANELRTLIDYHSCHVYVIEGDLLVPIAERGELTATGKEGDVATEPARIGSGIAGRAADLGRPVLIPNALESDFPILLPGVDEGEQSLLAVPLVYNRGTIGVVVVTKLGLDQFHEEDIRLLEVLGGQASVAIANARLYEAERREAEHAKALLDFASLISRAATFDSIGHETVRMAARLLEARQSSLWLQDELGESYTCTAHFGHVGNPNLEPIVQRNIGASTGDGFLADRSGPFVATPSELELHFGEPPTGPARRVAIAPLHSSHGLKGWIMVRHPEEHTGDFVDEQLRLLEGLSYQASIAMQKAILYKEQKEDAEVANALLEFSRELASAEGIDEVLQRVVELSARILGSPASSVWMQESGLGDLVPRWLWGYTEEESEEVSALRVPTDVARPFLVDRAPFVSEANETGLDDIQVLYSSGPLAVAPMHFDSQLGCIVVRVPGEAQAELSEKKMRLLAGVADQAQLAIANANSFESLERTFFETVEALANALEAKDEYTSSHARSITDMVLEVGADLGIEGRDLKRLELGALFHDIGKIGIPSDIIRKPGPLDDEEWRIMRMHPELGEKILAPIDRLADVRPIIRACHEHFDGSGYPDNLVADNIPIEARIILCCDAYDAMTTDRPYRKHLPHEEAIKRLKEASGAQFDPEVVAAFLRRFDPPPELAEAAS